MVFLGMGEDGHTASLFPAPHPEDPGASEGAVRGANAPAYVAVVGAKPPPRRVSLTYESLSAAESVMALVSGRGKAATLARVLIGEGALPMGRVLRERGYTTVWTDSFF
ncbi:hypothetical protein SDC9_199802 [bioreactor metagenome]|uniref:Glucosamine/galactosamine-6-phosphate isomerase domain-containing protein n=1 Tax=bioreactor metagenome TaxID=1076179 RepID=A0A645ILH6_9ZZZZ